MLDAGAEFLRRNAGAMQREGSVKDRPPNSASVARAGTPRWPSGAGTCSCRSASPRAAGSGELEEEGGNGESCLRSTGNDEKDSIH
jgi:hypothetical protein